MPRQDTVTYPTGTEWPRAIVAPPGGGRWIAARARIVDTTVVVMDRDHNPVAVYELDGRPWLDPEYPSPRLLGVIDGEELSIDVDGGCMCETTRWLNQGEWS